MHFLTGTTFDPWELWVGLAIFFLILMVCFYYFIKYLARQSGRPGRPSADLSAEGNEEDS